MFDARISKDSIKLPCVFVDGKFTLPKGATLVALRSLDEQATFKKTTDYKVSDGTVTYVATGALSKDSRVTLEYSLSSIDYSTATDDGLLTVTTDGLPENAYLSVSYKYVDPTKVTQADIIGGVQSDGRFAGCHLLKAAKSDVYVTPRILVSPHFTGKKPDADTADAVTAELISVAEHLKAIVYADAPSTTDTDAVAYRKDFGSKRLVVCDPRVKVLAPDGSYVYQPRSVRRAGLAAKIINDHGFHVLPSNRELSGVVGLERPVTEGKNGTANYLNENEIATALRLDGFREWGGRTCAADPKWAFESVVRTADMIQESIMLAHLWAVDRNITSNLVNSIVESVNAYLRDLKNRDVILGGKAWADPELNTPQTVAQGILYIDFDFTPPYPAEHIVFRSRLVNDYISEVFK